MEKKKQFLVRIHANLPHPERYWYGSCTGCQMLVEECDYRNDKGECFYKEVGGSGKINYTHVSMECIDYHDHNTVVVVKIKEHLNVNPACWYDKHKGDTFEVYARDTKHGFKVVKMGNYYIHPEHCWIHNANGAEIKNPNYVRKAPDKIDYYRVSLFSPGVIQQILERTSNFKKEQQTKGIEAAAKLPKVIDGKLVLSQEDFDKIPLDVLTNLMLKGNRDLKNTCLHYLGDEAQKWYATKDIVKVDGLEKLRLDLEKSKRTSFSRDELLFFINSIQALVTYEAQLSKTDQ